MPRSFNVDITDISRKYKSSPNFNDELMIIKLDGPSAEGEHQDRVRIDAFSLIVMLEGELGIDINGKYYQIDAPAFLDIMDIHAIRNMHHSMNFRGYHLIIAHNFMQESMRGIKRFPLADILSRYDYPIMKIEDSDANLLENSIVTMIKNIYRTDHIYQRDLVKNDIRTIFIEVSNIVMQKSKVEGAKIFRNKDDIIVQFIYLINKYCTKEHSVIFYARELCVESKYLSRILKAVNGKTANQWIDEALVTHAQMMLKEPDMPIQHIADHLNFSDQSSFGKFFKKHCGMSPLNYRRAQKY